MEEIKSKVLGEFKTSLLNEIKPIIDTKLVKLEFDFLQLGFDRFNNDITLCQGRLSKLESQSTIPANASVTSQPLVSENKLIFKELENRRRSSRNVIVYNFPENSDDKTDRQKLNELRRTQKFLSSLSLFLF